MQAIFNRQRFTWVHYFLCLFGMAGAVYFSSLVYAYALLFALLILFGRSLDAKPLMPFYSFVALSTVIMVVQPNYLWSSFDMYTCWLLFFVTVIVSYYLCHYKDSPDFPFAVFPATLVNIALHLFIFGVVFQSIDSLLTLMPDQRLKAPLSDSNSLAGLLTLFSLYFFHIWKPSFKLSVSNLFYLCFLGLFFWLLLKTHSRLMLVIYLLSMGLAFMFKLKELGISTKKASLYLVGGALVLGVAAWNSYIGERFKNLSSKEYSLMSRTALVMTTVDLIKEEPYGTGFYSWKPRYAAHRNSNDKESSGLTAHNDYLEITTDMGVAGGLILVWVGITFVMIALRARTILSLIPLVFLAQMGINFMLNFLLLNLFVGAIGGYLLYTHNKPAPRASPHQLLPLKLLLAGVLSMLVVLETPEWIAQGTLTEPQGVVRIATYPLTVEPVFKHVGDISLTQMPVSALASMYERLAIGSEEGPEKISYYQKAIHYFEKAIKVEPHKLTAKVMYSRFLDRYHWKDTSQCVKWDELTQSLVSKAPYSLSAYDERLRYLRGCSSQTAINQFVKEYAETPNNNVTVLKFLEANKARN